MNNAIKKLRWCILNIAFLVILYLGLIEHQKYFDNLALFLAWVDSAICICALLALSEDFLKKLSKSGGPAIYPNARKLLNVIAVLIIAASGHWVTAIAYLVGSVCFNAALYALEKRRSTRPDLEEISAIDEVYSRVHLRKEQP